VADDDPAIARGLRVRLAAAGYDTLVAADGQQALDAAVQQRPDLIVLDLRMPRMSGLTVMRKLRERTETARIPVIVLSANAGEQNRRKALELGARYFVQKPYEPRTLLEAIRAAFQVRAPEREAVRSDRVPPGGHEDLESAGANYANAYASDGIGGR
jgi:DNA-binding response OmpR family regulator